MKALHYHHTKSEDSDSIIPINRETALLIAAQPEGVDRALWLYELCRFLINKCNDLIIGFLFDDPPCSASTCPEMRASEWQFLCAVHESPKSCCAIDYCCHTLDWATNIVTSQKIFPSRLTLGAGDSLDPRGAGEKHLTNIFRRLHRIFAHAWFQHRGVFWQVEGQTGLYVLFKTVCDTYDLLPAENYKLPPEAEGLEPAEDVRPLPPSIMKSSKSSSSSNGRTGSTEEDFMSVPHTNTRRHIRGSPSVGSAVTTVLESDEEDPDVTQKLEDLSIADDTIVDIPVVVDTYTVDEEDEEEAEVDEDLSEPGPKAADILEHGPPTAALDKTFFEGIEGKEEPEEVEIERLAVDHSDFLDSPEVETPVNAKKEEDDVEDAKEVKEAQEKDVKRVEGEEGSEVVTEKAVETETKEEVKEKETEP